jgi:type IV secretory pathway protease TraF
MRFQTYHGPEQGGKVARRLAAVAVVLGVAVAWRRLRPFRVEVAGASMAPALLPGDYVVATAGGRVEVGSVVVAEDPRTPGFEVIKRVVAGPGDLAGDRPLAGGQLWLLGDDPARSTDSRTFGPVRREDVSGIVRLRYWPPKRLGPVR